MAEHIFEQQPHESKKLYERFKKYRNTRNTRKGLTLEEFAKQEGYSHSLIMKNSMKWNWRERADAWDAYDSQQLYEKVEHLFEDLNRRGLNDMDSFIDELNELRKDAMDRFRRGDINSTTCLNIMKNYIQCYREATEVYYINCRKPLFPPEVVETNDAVSESIENTLSENEAHNKIVALRKAGSQKIKRPSDNIR